ncbi:hypothetical protein, variant 1 [Aphanomyces astaci]|uniref:Uncharacterized protein n=1 Tax=Aphanomyces astaci TaxID=112090 RepID=W4HC08_APHAT|nr:hypothetical protein, variant 1 [Aphanomyces astaci]ETV88643.1 hypothetical protein, variant 1 [Aphanomyces astaci]|eukprot:XP_009821043.1 hypothetical protein, variant 1 [Aphanomyces astaci]
MADDDPHVSFGGDSFCNPPPPPPSSRRRVSHIPSVHFATAMHPSATAFPSDDRHRGVATSSHHFATSIASGKSPDKSSSRIPPPTRCTSSMLTSSSMAPSSSHIVSAERFPPMSKEAASSKRSLLRSASTIDLYHRHRPPKAQDKDSDSGSSDGSTRQGSTAPTKLRFPLRKKDSPGKLTKTTSFFGAPPTTPQPSPEKADDAAHPHSSDFVTQQTLRVAKLLGEKEQMELEYSDLMWKYTQLEGELQRERGLRADGQKDLEAIVATLTQQLEAQTAAAQSWEAKFIDAMTASNSNAITMAEFEEKEGEITRLWQCVDSMSAQVEGIATLTSARSTTQDCTVAYMNNLLEGKTMEIDALRSSLYDTVTLCFLHELAQGHDTRVLHTFMASLGSDMAAFEWIKARFCSKIIDDGPFSKLENCVGTIVVHAGSSHVLAGIVDEDAGDGFVLPALDFSVVKTASPVETCLECVEQADGVHTIALGGYLSRRRSLMEASTRKSMFSIVFDDLDVRPAQYKMVAVVKPLLSRKDKAKLSTMLLQEFGVAALMLPTTAEMVLRNCGLTTGIVVDIGVDATYVVPIYDSTIMTHAVVQLFVGGHHVVEHTAALFRASSPPFAALAPDMQMQLASAIVQSKAHVAYDATKEGGGDHTSHPPVSFEIQKDMASWALAADMQLYLGPEVLFQPSLHLQGSYEIK